MWISEKKKKGFSKNYFPALDNFLSQPPTLVAKKPNT